MCKTCGCGATEQHPQVVDFHLDLLGENNRLADRIRSDLHAQGILAVNLMGSPGSGKTTLLELTAEYLAKYPPNGHKANPQDRRERVWVIEGDLATNKDALRLQKAGVGAYQITTGQACHLDAQMIAEALASLRVQHNSLLFIENVGNLVCPAVYDVGAHLNVVLLSVPEGDDKIDKYPLMFAQADLVVITKTDCLAMFEFSVDTVRESLERIQPQAKLISTAKNSPESLEPWLKFLGAHTQVCA